MRDEGPSDGMYHHYVSFLPDELQCFNCGKVYRWEAGWVHRGHHMCSAKCCTEHDHGKQRDMFGAPA